MSSTKHDALVEDLDALYQESLVRLENQTRDAMFIDSAIRRLLDQAPGDDSVIEWDPKRAMNPRLAFRSIALRIVEESRKDVTRGLGITKIDYEDLLVWTDEPQRKGTVSESFLAYIEYARTKTLKEFWHRLQARIRPDQDPETSAQQAVADLMNAFAIVLPKQVVIPYTRVLSKDALSLSLQRQEHDLELVISPVQLQNIIRANHAICTLLLLHNKTPAAEHIYEVTNSIQNKMKSNYCQYQHKDVYHASSTMQIRFMRENVNYAMEDFVFDIVRKEITTRDTQAEYLPAHLVAALM